MKIPPCATAAALLACAAMTASGDDTELEKITLADARFGDQFGFALAADGPLTLIGAYSARTGEADFNGEATLVQSGSTTTFEGSMNTSGDRFGWAVAVDGDLLAVGATHDDINGGESGIAYLFNADPLSELTTLTPDDGQTGDFFGHSIGVSGGLAAVGASRSDALGDDSGAAYLFDAATGNQLFKLLASDGEEGDEFGFSIAIAGNVVVVGAPNADAGGSGSGAAYVFDASSGAELAKLVADDASSLDAFGYAVAIDGSTIVVGARNAESAGVSSGAAYLFDASSFAQLHKLVPGDANTNDLFGNSVDIDDGLVLIGAPGDSDDATLAGSAYLFDATTGDELRKYTASDAAFLDNLGNAVALAGSEAFVGAPLEDTPLQNSGAVYVFDATRPPLCPGDLADSSGFGPPDDQVDFGDFFALSFLAGQCGAGTPNPDCAGDLADSSGFGPPDGTIDFGDFFALSFLAGPCP